MASCVGQTQAQASWTSSWFVGPLVGSRFAPPPRYGHLPPRSLAPLHFRSSRVPWTPRPFPCPFRGVIPNLVPSCRLLCSGPRRRDPLSSPS
eukprot:3925042-Heterocapsa_arctica.AAC.1